MHAVINYGSLLQAYATQYILEKLGHDVEIIDYQFPNQYQFSHGCPHYTMRFYNKVARLFRIKPRHRLEFRIRRFMKSHLHLSRKYDYETIHHDAPVYDVYMTGSDQVWNTHHTYGDPTFLLDFAPPRARCWAFSPSIANSGIPANVRGLFISQLSKYEQISVRENGGREIIQKLIGRDVEVTLDPTLMLSREEWLEVAGQSPKSLRNRRYVLLYMMSYAFDPKPYIYELLASVQKLLDCEVITFTPIPKEVGLRHVTCLSDASPEMFIHLFASAEAVVTSSFHGTAFAVNLRRPLYSIVSKEAVGDDRQRSLLKQVSLEGSIIEKGTPTDQIQVPSFEERKNAIHLLELLKKESVDFLTRI